MNREPNVDEIVARWVDDGPEVAQERFVWAALEAVEHTPQRGAWRVALENAPMFTKIAVPALGVAVVLLIAVIAYQQLGTDRGPGQEPSVSPSPSSAATIDCGVSAPGKDSIEVVWCVPRGTSRLVMHFTMGAPSAWAARTYNSGQALYLRPPSGGAIAFGLGGPRTVDDWVRFFTSEPAFQVSEPAPISLDGIDGYVFDVRLAAGANAADAPAVLEDIELPWKVKEGSVERVWILDTPEEPLAIVTGSSEAGFEAWAATVGAAVQTLHWDASP